MKAAELQCRRIGLYDVKDQLKQHVYRRSAEAFAAGDCARDALSDIAQLERRKLHMREAFLQSIGGLPQSDASLDVQVTGILRGDGYTVEKVLFQSRPGHWVTGNVYKPEGTASPTAAVLHLCGHNPLAKQADLYQSVSQRLVRAGLIVLTTDPIGQGERLSYCNREDESAGIAASTCEHEHAGRQCLPLGDNSARYFLHDAMRAVDYLCSRPDVDPARIGVTGCSGGGTQTSMMMLCDPRIAAAAPAAFIMSRESYLPAGQAQDAEQVWAGLTKLGFDHEDLLLAMAPRPALVLAAQYDFFPIEGTRRTVERASRYWRMYGTAENLEYVEDACVHDYSPVMAQAAAEFFSRRLLGKKLDGGPIPQIRPVPPERLHCTSSGQVRTSLDRTRAVYEENIDRLAELERASSAVPDDIRKQRAMAWLRERIEAGRSRCPLNPRREPLLALEEGLTAERLLWWSQPDLFSHGILLRASESAALSAPIMLALWPRGTSAIVPHLDRISRACAEGNAVLVLDVSGDGALAPNPVTPRGMHEQFGTIHKLASDLYWLDDSLAALRTFDVLRALDLVEWLGGGRTGEIGLYAEGRFGLYAELAQLLDNRLREVEVADGMRSVADFVRSRHYELLDSEGIVMPGMLRHLDLPDVRRWTRRA